jgi:hypothetical protein
MFGRMSVDAILSVERGCDPLTAVRSLVERAEGVKVIKWIEFPDSILVFFMVRGDMTSGSIYVLDRKSRVWYWIDFEDRHYGGYSREESYKKGCQEKYFPLPSPEAGTWSIASSPVSFHEVFWG